MRAMQQRAERVIPLEENFQKLVDAGLLRFDSQGNVNSVNSWEEHQQILSQKL